MAVRRVDVHAHYLPSALLEAYGRRREPPCLVTDGGRQLVDMGGPIAYPVLPKFRDLDAQFETMEAHGITTTLLTVVPPAADGLGADAAAVARAANDELAELTSSGSRFAACATLPAQQPDQAADELARAVSLGLRGAGVFSNVAGERLDDERFRPIFEAAAELDVPLLLHPTTSPQPVATDYALPTTIGFLVETALCALRLVLSGLYDRHPELKFLVPHVGSVLPYLLGRIDYEAARYPGGRGALDVDPSEHIRRFYVDSVCVWPPALDLVLRVFDHDRILFGTDEPFWETERAVDTVEAMKLDEDTAAALYHGNADRLFRL